MCCWYLSFEINIRPLVSFWKTLTLRFGTRECSARTRAQLFGGVIPDRDLSWCVVADKLITTRYTVEKVMMVCWHFKSDLFKWRIIDSAKIRLQICDSAHFTVDHFFWIQQLLVPVVLMSANLVAIFTMLRPKDLCRLILRFLSLLCLFSFHSLPRSPSFGSNPKYAMFLIFRSSGAIPPNESVTIRLRFRWVFAGVTFTFQRHYYSY